MLLWKIVNYIESESKLVFVVIWMLFILKYKKEVVLFLLECIKIGCL